MLPAPGCIKHITIDGNEHAIVLSPDFDVRLDDAKARLIVSTVDLEEAAATLFQALDAVRRTLLDELMRLEAALACGDHAWRQSERGRAFEELATAMKRSMIVFDPQQVTEFVLLINEARALVDRYIDGFY